LASLCFTGFGAGFHGSSAEVELEGWAPERWAKAPPRAAPYPSGVGEGWELVSPLEDFAWRSGDWLRPFFSPERRFFDHRIHRRSEKKSRCGDLLVATVRQVFTEGMSGIWCSSMMAETMFLL
jgi:hypothetical protein